MAAILFKVSDRVRARTAGFVPADTLGTILEVLLAVPGMYYVQFDGYAESKLMQNRDVDAIADAASSASARSAPDRRIARSPRRRVGNGARDD
ncbi:MAG TPA: hypothetical protein VGJ87_22460 [Roseiflexaceae bacterium]|jgi:hypothetical protein